MKLLSISFASIPRMPGHRPGDIMSIDTSKPGDAFLGWRISIRGQQVFFVSPPGGKLDRTKPTQTGPVTVFETSRAEVTLQWRCAPDEVEAVLKGGKYDSEPFGPPPEIVPTKPLLEQIPVSQMGDA